MPASLSGQKVVILGGTSGIGLAVAEAAIADGAHVVVGSSQPANVDAAAKRLGQAASGAAVNVKDEANVAAFFAGVGAFDHLVFTAGDWEALGQRPLTDLDFDAAGEALQVRFWGALRAIKHALPQLSQSGSITVTNGVLAHKPMKGMPLATAFAGASEHLVRGLAVDLAPVRVNCVCPGFVLTERWAGAGEMVKGLTARQPLARGAEPDEVAQAYIYAMRAGYTTGQVLVVDGGMLLV